MVEHEKDLWTPLSDLLRAEEYVVDTGADGLGGFDMPSNRSFDLTILDLMLPVRSGLEVCRDIRQPEIATPILVVAVLNETVDKVVGLRLDADN